MKIVKVSAVPMSAPVPEDKRHRTDLGTKVKSDATLIRVETDNGIIGIGASPFGDQRLGYISGGRFFGPRINGIVLPGGGNWSRSGRLGDDRCIGSVGGGFEAGGQFAGLDHFARQAGNHALGDAFVLLAHGIDSQRQKIQQLGIAEGGQAH